MFCKNCGHQLPDGAKFCNNCGKLIDNTVANPVQEHKPKEVQQRYTEKRKPEYEKKEYGNTRYERPEYEKHEYKRPAPEAHRKSSGRNMKVYIMGGVAVVLLVVTAAAGVGLKVYRDKLNETEQLIAEAQQEAESAKAEVERQKEEAEQEKKEAEEKAAKEEAERKAAEEAKKAEEEAKAKEAAKQNANQKAKEKNIPSTAKQSSQKKSSDKKTTQKKSDSGMTIYTENSLVVPEVAEASSEYIFPDSDSRYLTRDEINRLSLREINYAKNEIYARRGRKFQSRELQNYFNSKSWYWGSIEPGNFQEGILNTYENANANLLAEIEFSIDSRGYQLDQ